MKLDLTFENKVFFGSVGMSALLILLGLVTGDKGVLGNAVIISIFLIFLSWILFKYEKQRTLREIEEKMPIFLRDIIESLRSGMLLHQAIMSASKLDYGRLSDEVKKMASQISWGMPVTTVLNQLTNRMKESKRLYMALSILRESYMTGGEVVSTLEALSNNLTQLDDLSKERRSLLNQYMILIYAMVFIFIFILIAINKLMVPIFQSAAQAGEVVPLTHPCVNNPSVICTIYKLPAIYIFGFEDPNNIGAYYTSVFFYMGMIVAIIAGLVVGQITENSLTSGIMHSVILSGCVIGLLLILKAVNFLGV